MSLFGAVAPVRIRTTARVDRAFALQSFDFLLDPGTGPTTVQRRARRPSPDADGHDAGGTTSEARELDEPPAAVVESWPPARRRGSGRRHAPPMAALRSGDAAQRARACSSIGAARDSPSLSGVGAGVQGRDGVRRPAHDVVGDRHGRSRQGREPDGAHDRPRERTDGAGLDGQVAYRPHLLESSAVVPTMKQPHRRAARRAAPARSALTAWISRDPELQGAGQIVEGDIVELVDPQSLDRGAGRSQRRASYLAPEPFIESDDPAIVAEAAGRGAADRPARARAPSASRATSTRCSRRSRPSACRRRAKCCGRKSATATSTRRSTSRWRARSASRRASPSG